MLRAASSHSSIAQACNKCPGRNVRPFFGARKNKSLDLHRKRGVSKNACECRTLEELFKVLSFREQFVQRVMLMWRLKNVIACPWWTWTTTIAFCGKISAGVFYEAIPFTNVDLYLKSGFFIFHISLWEKLRAFLHLKVQTKHQSYMENPGLNHQITKEGNFNHFSVIIEQPQKPEKILND